MKKKRYLILKRVLDFVLSLCAVAVLSPFGLALCLAVKLDSRGPVFFKQKRVGIHKTYFNILKFRTMRTDTPCDTPTHLLNDPDRWITGVGRFLRKTSLDELPQLLNILKGDMSFVGPRPALWNQYDLIAQRDEVGANDVPQGLTGWAQINGRDELEICDKARYDGEYAEKINLWFDIKCVCLSLAYVLKSRNVREGGTGNKS